MVLVPTAVLVMLPTVAVTEALTISVKVWLIAKLAVVAIAPVVLVLNSVPLLTGVPDRLKPLSASVSVTFSAVLGPKLTSVKV